MNNLSALGLAFLSGLFFLIGFILVKYFKKKKELSVIATGMAFIVMIGMILFDLGPEIIELINSLEFCLGMKICLTLLFLSLGVFLLKLLDIFLPAHHHDHQEKENVEEHNHHMFHVGFIMASSLILHNILEGMSMYVVACESLSSGMLMAVGVGLHNLPLGIEIATSMSEKGKNNKLKYFTMFFLICSSFLGALILFLSGIFVSHFLLFAFICVATGMILYITIFELFHEVYTYRKSKFTYFGMLIGIFFLLIMTIIE